MKKASTLLFLALCSSAAVHAQTPTPEALLKRAQQRIASFGPAFAPKPVLKGTAVTEQVASEAVFAADSFAMLQLTDSVHFVYNTRTRSQQFDFNNFQYVDLFNLGNGGSTNYLAVEPRPNNEDSMSLRLVEFDTLRHYEHDAATGVSSLSTLEYALYNADTTLNALHSNQFSPAGSPVGSLRQVLTYNSAGQLTAVYGLELNGTSWDTASVRNISYTSGGLVILDSLTELGASPIPSTRQTYYTYNAAGQYTTRTRVAFSAMSGTFDTTDRTTNTYYANGQLHTVVEEQNAGNGLQLFSRDSLWYTPGVPGFTGFAETVYDVDSTELLSYRMVADGINAMQLKDSVTFYVNLFGFELPVLAMKTDYNANGNPIATSMYDIQTGTPMLAALRRWHYYTDGGNTGIKPRNPLAGSIRIYPNPTTGSITLDPSAVKPGTHVSVRIMNMAGQLVQTESFVLQGRQQIGLGNHAAPGQYLISVLDSGGNLLCNQQITKQ